RDDGESNGEEAQRLSVVAGALRLFVPAVDGEGFTEDRDTCHGDAPRARDRDMEQVPVERGQDGGDRVFDDGQKSARARQIETRRLVLRRRRPFLFLLGVPYCMAKTEDFHSASWCAGGAVV